jgi:hypothetical protein
MRSVKAHLVPVLCLVAVLSSCSRSHANLDGDSNTNWLRSCARDGDCADALACVCGLCTSTCLRDSECSDLADDAICMAGSVAVGDGSKNRKTGGVIIRFDETTVGRGDEQIVAFRSRRSSQGNLLPNH